MKNVPIAMLDLFLVLLLIVMQQWVFAMLLINPAEESKPTLEPTAHFTMRVTWDEPSSDVDCWAMITNDPDSICGFKRREVGNLQLTNDHTSLTYGSVDGKPVTQAVENLNITSIHAAEYAFNIDGYSIRTNPTNVTVEIYKNNPKRLLYSKQLTIDTGQEEHICRVTIDSDGSVLSVDDSLPIYFVRSQL